MTVAEVLLVIVAKLNLAALVCLFRVQRRLDRLDIAVASIGARVGVNYHGQ